MYACPMLKNTAHKGREHAHRMDQTVFHAAGREFTAPQYVTHEAAYRAAISAHMATVEPRIAS